MTSHPVDLVYVDGVAVAKSDVRGFAKLRERLRVADATEIRNTTLSGHYGGLYVASLQQEFDLDTADTTTADDGTSCIIDFAGNRFKKREVTLANSERVVIAAGAVTITSVDDVVLINKTVPAATTVNLPASSTRSGARVKIVDLARNASSYPITINPTNSPVTITIASPGIVTWASHGLVAGTPVVLTTTGALPTGFTAGTTYYVASAGLAAGSFRLAATVGGAAINTSGSQSGVHTATAETIVGLTSFVLATDGASIELHPQPDTTGWYI